MNNSPKVSTAPQSQSPAKPLTAQERRRWQLARHLCQLVDANPQEARRALEMSQEGLPEMYLIALYEPRNNWAEAVMNSDSMHSLMVRERPPQEMQALMQTLLEADCLEVVLEQLL